MTSLRAFALLALLPLAAACSGSDDGGSSQPQPTGSATHAVFVVPSSLSDLANDTWFDHPWPSDMRVDPDGAIHLEGWRNPRTVPLLAQYIESMKGVIHGFSPVAAGYLRFDGPLDPASLPADPGESVAATSTVQLIDVDDASPEKGQRKLLTLYWRAEEGVYWLPNTLAFMPTMGYPLMPHTRYAVVVTDGVRGADGQAVQPSEELRQVLGLKPASGAAQTLRDAWAPDVAALQAAGIAPEHVAHMTVFTTADPTAETIAVAHDARTVQPVPKVDETSWVKKEHGPGFQVYEGKYGPSPDYQKGTPPFAHDGDGGAFEFDAAGRPVKQREFNPRFALAIPDAASCPIPTNGYPIVMYAHGTGGSYRSFLSDGTAKSLATKCIASMGVDQIMHPGRLPEPVDPQWSPELLFFNFQNPDAARTNPRQSAVDEVVRARLAREGHIVVPATISTTGNAIPIDPSTVIFYGHSQGGLNGPLFLAVDDGARGGVLSGSGSMISITLLEKTLPAPSVAGLVRSLLFALSTPEYEELNYLHPGVSLVQTFIDVADPVHYVPLLVRRPLDGFAPKSIYQTEGVNPDFTGDSYTPPHAIEVQAVATGLPVMTPVIHPIEEAQWSGLGTVTIPAGGLAGNLANGQASGVLAQWPASEADDGHFVIFDIPAASEQAAGFCRNLAHSPVGRVPPP